MKKRLMSLSMAIMLLFSLSVSAFAAEESEAQPIPLTLEETEVVRAARGAIMSGGGYMPLNTDGTNGNPCDHFTATSTSMIFMVTSVRKGYATTYNAALFNADTGKVVYHYQPAQRIGLGVMFPNLQVGTTYYCEISSDDCSGDGVDINYEIWEA